MDSNLWYRNTTACDFPSIPGIVGGSTTGEADVGGGLHRVRHLNATFGHRFTAPSRDGKERVRH
jgi:hypothetical protein